MTKPAIIVAGLGRCGTSLMMQMLDAAGVPCLGAYPAYEPSTVCFENYPVEILTTGRAMKVLDPHRINLPVLTDHVVLWMDRAAKHQASSMAKLIGPMAGRAPTSVPMKQPMKPIRRFCPVRATPKPCQRYSKLMELSFQVRDGQPKMAPVGR